MFIPDPLAKTYCLPVRVVKRRAEYFYGGPLPAIREGAIGDLTLPAHAVLVDTPWDWLDKEFEVEMLSEGTVVWLMLHPHTEALAKKAEHLVNPYLGGSWMYMRVELREPLHLLMRGTKQAKLLDCRCGLPTLKKEAESLNHAYRLASEELEPQRRSHAGNMFQLGFWKDGERLRRLGDLRDAYQANLEQHLVFVKRFYTLFGPITIRDTEGGYPSEDEVSGEFWERLQLVQKALSQQVRADKSLILRAAHRDFTSFSDAIGQRLKDGIDSLADPSLPDDLLSGVIGDMLVAAHKRMFRKLAVEDGLFVCILDILNGLLGAAIASQEANRDLMYDVRQYVLVALVAPAQRRGDRNGQFTTSDVVKGMGLKKELLPLVMMALKQPMPLEPGLTLMTEQTAGIYTWRTDLKSSQTRTD